MNRSQFRTVLSFEYSNYLRSKAFRIATLIVAALLVLGISLPSLLSALRRQNQQPARLTTTYIVDETGQIRDLVWLKQALPDQNWELHAPDQLAKLREDLAESESKSRIMVIEATDRYRLIVRQMGLDMAADPRLSAAFARYFRQSALTAAGLSVEQAGKLAADPQLVIEDLAEAQGKSMTQTYLFTYLMIFLLYMTVMLYGQLVATSVASEKSNRAMELLITSARPINLMTGKVIGSGLAGLTQIAFWLIIAILAYQLNRTALNEIPMVGAIFQMPPSLLVYLLLFYLLGYFMFAFLYGAFGSLVSRQEDVQTIILPLTFLVIAAMCVAIFGMMSPESNVIKVFSFLPYFGPMTMFVRVAMAQVPIWQLVLSIAVMLLTIAGGAWLGARIYRLGVLMYGKPPRLKEIMRLLRHWRET